MTPKEYLSQIKDIEDYVKSKEIELYKLNCLATSITAPSDREAVQSSNISDKVGNVGAKIADLSRLIQSQKERQLAVQTECINTIDEVRQQNKLFYIILHKRYVQYKNLKQIASEEHYSYDYIREMHGRALQKVGKILQNQKEPTQTHI